MNFAYKLRELLKTDLFAQSELKAVLYPLSDAAIHNGISRALKSKDLVQLKRGLYTFSQKLRKGLISDFAIANKLYTSSYISFESALSYYNLIPERVYTTTSACHQRKSKIFSNEIGNFSYEYIPCDDFFLEVTHDQNKGNILIATPLRALFDLIYLQKKRYLSISELEEDLRIDTDCLIEEVKKYSVEDLSQLASQYKKRNVLDFFTLLIKAFK